MQSLNKNEAANHSPKTQENHKGRHHYTKALLILQDLRDGLWYEAMKYRHDPVVGGACQEALDKINKEIQGEAK